MLERYREREYRRQLKADIMPATHVEDAHRNNCRHLEENGVLPEEQKGCKRNCRCTKDQLLIAKVILRDCKKRKTNLAMSWIDYRKAYDMIPHSWIMECLNLFWCCIEY